MSLDLSCPRETSGSERIRLAHGGGGSQMRDFINQYIRKHFPAPPTESDHDAALVPGFDQIILTTDSYVVNPLFFPGGNIGSLAVCGTINDLWMAGGVPQYLTLSLIIEEGLPTALLDDILTTIAKFSKQEGVSVVTGDTKVVERGQCDAIYINTTGVAMGLGPKIHPDNISPGDCILVNGDIGRHGAAVMAARDQIESQLTSDVKALSAVVRSLLTDLDQVQCMRDLTRGGLASAVNELARYCNLGVALEESEIPRHPEVESYCEILGLDAEHIACEGRFITVVRPHQVPKALKILRQFDHKAKQIGTFTDQYPGQVWLNLPWGGKRGLPMLTGELLPRIC